MYKRPRRLEPFDILVAKLFFAIAGTVLIVWALFGISYEGDGFQAETFYWISLIVGAGMVLFAIFLKRFRWGEEIINGAAGGASWIPFLVILLILAVSFVAALFIPEKRRK